MKKILFLLLFLPLFSSAQSTIGLFNNALTAGSDSTVTVNGVLKVAEATYLFAFFGDSTVTYTYAASDTWYHVTNATDSLFRYTVTDGFTVSNDTITIPEAGDYDLTFQIQFIGGNAKSYTFRFYNVTQTAGIPTSGGVMAEGDGDIVQAVVSAYLANAQAGDKIVVQTKQNDTDAATLKSSTIKIRKVHE